MLGAHGLPTTSQRHSHFTPQVSPSAMDHESGWARGHLVAEGVLEIQDEYREVRRRRPIHSGRLSGSAGLNRHTLETAPLNFLVAPLGIEQLVQPLSQISDRAMCYGQHRGAITRLLGSQTESDFLTSCAAQTFLLPVFRSSRIPCARLSHFFLTADKTSFYNRPIVPPFKTCPCSISRKLHRTKASALHEPGRTSLESIRL